MDQQNFRQIFFRQIIMSSLRVNEIQLRKISFNFNLCWRDCVNTFGQLIQLLKFTFHRIPIVYQFATIHIRPFTHVQYPLNLWLPTPHLAFYLPNLCWVQSTECFGHPYQVSWKWCCFANTSVFVLTIFNRFVIWYQTDIAFIT